MYVSCDGADSRLIFHVSLSVNWCNLKRLMPQINPKSFHSLSLLYPLCSLTFPIFSWPPPLLVCLLSLPTPSCVFGFCVLISVFPTSTHPHSHSLCDFFLLVPPSLLAPSFPHLSVFSPHLSFPLSLILPYQWLWGVTSP